MFVFSEKIGVQCDPDLGSNFIDPFITFYMIEPVFVG